MDGDKTDKARVSSLLDDNFYNLLNGNECTIGTNYRWINKQIDLLKSKNSLSDEEKVQLNKYYSETKRTQNGKRKPKTCWDFVNNDKCIHCNKLLGKFGKVLDNRWHPSDEEKEYLKRKSGKKV